MKEWLNNAKISSITKKMKKLYSLFVVSIDNIKILKYQTFLKKYKFFLLFAVSAKMKIKNI